MSLKTLCVCALLTVASACATANAPAAGASDDAEARPTSRNRDVITLADLTADPTLRAQNVLDVVRALRPQFLNERGTNTHSDPEAGKVHASIDNGRIVPLSELSGMNGSEVTEIRFLNVAQAMQKFGVAARQGPVILVSTAAAK